MTFTCGTCSLPLKPAEEKCPRCQAPRRMGPATYELYVLRPVPLFEPEWQPVPAGDGFIYDQAGPNEIWVRCYSAHTFVFSWTEDGRERWLSVYPSMNGGLVWEFERDGNTAGGTPPSWLHAVGIDAAARALQIKVPIFCAMYTDRPPEFWLP